MKTEPITWPLPDDWLMRQYWRTYDRTRWRIARQMEIETSPGCYSGNGMMFERVTILGYPLTRPDYWTTMCFRQHAEVGQLLSIIPTP